MARMENSQQIDLQQGTVYSLQMKWLDADTHKKRFGGKAICGRAICDTILCNYPLSSF